ncbi:hypothetical protein HG537_0A03890 [Torulaspora globosa]|uniref:CP-type G domain-containing protein n=1 Tax=Torulaspora globosa TaxID=48254 RepID=A0A7H9HPC4_9SACH|nr:hypothetical protein HG537_0A03890 [Torulaspora sp. CBS 2947]
MKKFIPRFDFPDYNIPRTDFKGHQLKALRKFESLRPQLNLILELRDVRAPLSTRNILIDQLIDKRIHQRLVIYTKRDLIADNTQYLQRLSHWQQELDEPFILINANQRRSARHVLDIIKSYKRQLEHCNQGLALPAGYKVLVTGMPNVGKSTLINTLRGSPRKVARTGPHAGVTRNTSETIRVGEPHDNIYLIDTPGIGLPGRLVNERQRMLSLSLCGCIKTNLVDPVIQADYLLYLANLQEPQKHYPGTPTNDVYQLLNRFGTPRDNITAAAVYWLQQSHRGLIYDRELLLDTDSFSLRGYLSRQPQPDPRSKKQSRMTTRDRQLQNVNQLFPKLSDR